MFEIDQTDYYFTNFFAQSLYMSLFHWRMRLQRVEIDETVAYTKYFLRRQMQPCASLIS